ncbi:exosome complex component MTR3-like [Orbicella faveolata]|uniref:exosome complex component MTR3-like n=1 Tax=Orbicella faveolata TaxID=48498 RepID=UPI0009E498B0|nr:exosome complex component MTR3-like [Orbicella faveolata]
MPVDSRRIAGPEETQPVVSGIEKCFENPLTSNEGLRKDGRKVDELRPIFLRSGVVSQARGSAYIEMQKTKVTCAVYGPRESQRQHEFSEKVQKGNTSLMDPTFQEGLSSEADGKVTVAFLPTMNVVSGLLQDGELTHEQSVKALKCCMEGCARTYPVLQDALVHTVKRTVKSKHK